MNKQPLTPYQRVINVLKGEIPDKTPFTIYETKLPRSAIERKLRNDGLCLVMRTTSYKVIRPNVKVESHHYVDENGRNVIKTVYYTPYGELSTVVEPAGFTSWTHERMFKGPDDYKALLFMIQDTIVQPDYGTIMKKLNELGEDYIIRDNLPSEPLQALISGYIGMENFCYEWMDRQDEILKLYHALVDVARKVYPIVAEGPLEFVNYGGNVVPQVIGVENFIKYYVPNYQEAAEILHKKGKMIGTHLDGNNQTIMQAVSQTNLDYIEAYDPGMSPPVKEARALWPDKVIWINWPSSWHLRPLDEVRRKTVEILEESSPGDRLIIGITEDVPEDRMQMNLLEIMRAINEYYSK